MKKRLLCFVAILALLGCVSCGRTHKVAADDAPIFRVYDEEGNELPMYELSDDEVEAILNAPTVALSVEDLTYFLATGQSFLDYGTGSVPDFRNEQAKTAQGARSIEGTEEYEVFDEPYLEGPTINMENFADMVDFYKDHNESVALLIYYAWDPFRGEAYQRKFDAYASSFERADVLQYFGESRESPFGEDEETTLGEALMMVPTGQYDHLLIASAARAFGDAEELAQQITPRDDFKEVIIFTYDVATLRACPESATVLSEKFGVIPILRPLMAWEDKMSE